jgi:hypothetical protein
MGKDRERTWRRRALTAAAGVGGGLLMLLLAAGPGVFMVSVPGYLGPKDVAITPGAGPVVLDWPSLAPSSRVDRWYISRYTVTVHAKAPVVVGLTDAAGVRRRLGGTAYDELARMAGTGDGDPTQPVWRHHAGGRYGNAAAETWTWSARSAGASASLTIPRTSRQDRVVVLAGSGAGPSLSATVSVRAVLRGGGWLSWPLVVLYGWGGGLLLMVLVLGGRPPGSGRPYPARRL